MNSGLPNRSEVYCDEIPAGHADENVPGGVHAVVLKYRGWAGNHCMLRALLNALQDPEKIQHFLQGRRGGSPDDFSPYKEFIARRPEHRRLKDPMAFSQGVTTEDVYAYLKHIKKAGFIREFIWRDVTKSVNMLRYFVEPDARKSGESFLVIGYYINAEHRDRILHKFQTDGAFDISKYRTYSKEAIALLNQINCANDQEAVTNLREGFRKLCPKSTLHASAIKFDNSGVAYILEPGRFIAHKLLSLEEDPRGSGLNEIAKSAAVLYRVFRFSISC